MDESAATAGVLSCSSFLRLRSRAGAPAAFGVQVISPRFAFFHCDFREVRPRHFDARRGKNCPCLPSQKKKKKELWRK